VDGIRLVAIAEPAGCVGSAGRAGPASGEPPRVANRVATRQGRGVPVPRGLAASARAGPDVLGRVMASRLDLAVPGVRWGIGAGDDDASASTRAELALRRARERGTGLGFATGDPWRDALLADLGLTLAALLDDLTPRQAEIAGLILVDGARQAEVAAALGVSRATVSVTVARGRLAAIAGARRAIEALLVGPPVEAATRDAGGRPDAAGGDGPDGGAGGALAARP
jgi:DNA-binding CsgD family transcriptional regulator